jgi:hypothetical protein
MTYSNLRFWPVLTCLRSTFATAEKKSYIQAVKCLSKLPSKTPKAKCPGCKSRFDDFLGTHINQTFAVCSKVVIVYKNVAYLSRFTTLATSSDGTVTSLGHMSKHFALSVDTRDINPTITGLAGHTTLWLLLHSTALKLPCPATVPWAARNRKATEFPQTPLHQSAFLTAQAEAVLHPVRSETGPSTLDLSSLT